MLKLIKSITGTCIYFLQNSYNIFHKKKNNKEKWLLYSLDFKISILNWNKKSFTWVSFLITV